MQPSVVGCALAGFLLLLLGKTIAFENVCKEPFQCYECSSFKANESLCGDPFNATEFERVVRKSDCKDACVKWVVKETPQSPEKVIRTCSSQLDIRFPINYVCIHETRSGHGSLCFCNKDLCNAAHTGNRSSTHSIFLAAFSLLLFVVSHTLLVHR